MTLTHRFILGIFGIFAFFAASTAIAISTSSPASTVMAADSTSTVSSYSIAWMNAEIDGDGHPVIKDTNYTFSDLATDASDTNGASLISNLAICVKDSNGDFIACWYDKAAYSIDVSTKISTPISGANPFMIGCEAYLGSAVKNDSISNYVFKTQTSGVYYILYTAKYNDSSHYAMSSVMRSITVAGTSVWDQFNSFLSKNTALTTSVVAIIYSGAATIFARIIMSVFKFGVVFKSNFVTKEDMQEYQRSTQSSLAASVHEMQNTVLGVCQHQIDKGLEPVAALISTKNDIDADIQKINIKYQDFSDRYDEIKRVSQSVVSLSNRVARIESGGTVNENSRRKDV
jgi:ABC-type multidrug transport system fused ATPase/permease subunit